MIGESVMTPPRFFLVFHRVWTLVRRFATAPPSERRGGVEKPFPFFGE